MAKRKIKSLNKTGRISRKKASATAVSLREATVKTGKVGKKTRISKKTTASGRGKIAFHVTGELDTSEQRRPA